MYKKSIDKINRIGKIGHISVTIVLIAAIICTALLSAAAIIISTDNTHRISVMTTGNKTYVSSKGSILEKAAVYCINNASGKSVIISPDNSDEQIEVSVNDTTSLKNNSVYAEISASPSLNNSSAKSDFLLIVLTVIIASITLIAALFAVKDLLKYISHCSTPFNNIVVKKLRMLGLMLIPVVISSSVAGTVVFSVLNPSNQLILSFNTTLAIAVIMIFVAAYILKYGIQLQKESDETL